MPPSSAASGNFPNRPSLCLLCVHTPARRLHRSNRQAGRQQVVDRTARRVSAHVRHRRVAEKLSKRTAASQVQELRAGRAAIEEQVRDLTVAHSSAEADAAAARGRAAGLEAACQAHVARVTALSAKMAKLQQAQARLWFTYASL